MTSLMGKKIKQTRSLPNVTPVKYIDREATVDDEFDDEEGNHHIHTDDGVWCPASLCDVVVVNDLDELNAVDEALYAAARKAREVARRVKASAPKESHVYLHAEEILDVCKAVLD